MKSNELKEYLSYLKDPKTIEDNKNNMLNQVIQYLNHKYPFSSVKLDIENSLINIEGEDQYKVLEELNDIGLVTKEDYKNETSKDI